MKPDYFASAAEVKRLLKPQSVSSTATGTGIATANYQGGMLITMDADKASAGTTPTLIVTIQTATENSFSSPTTLKTFTTVTDAAGDGVQTAQIMADQSLGFIRAVGTIAGTNSPTFAFSVTAAALKHY